MQWIAIAFYFYVNKHTLVYFLFQIVYFGIYEVCVCCESSSLLWLIVCLSIVYLMPYMDIVVIVQSYLTPYWG